MIEVQFSGRIPGAPATGLGEEVTRLSDGDFTAYFLGDLRLVAPEIHVAMLAEARRRHEAGIAQ